MTEIDTAEAIQEHTADRSAFLREKLTNGASKVCYVDLPVCGQERRLRFTFNAWCDLETEIAAPSPMVAYRQLLDGRASPALVRAIILHGLKWGAADEDFKAGPVVDQLMADYPFAVALGVAEVAVAAWLVGVDKPSEG